MRNRPEDSRDYVAIVRTESGKIRTVNVKADNVGTACAILRSMDCTIVSIG